MIALTMLRTLALVAVTAFAVSGGAQAGPFGTGWTMDPEASTLTFQSIKNGSKVETSQFASYQGAIDADGSAEIRIQLDSVDTGVDLRNVRMRFLFFETFKHPEAVVTASIDPGAIADLPAKRRMTIPLDYQLDLHGITQTLTVPTVVTLITEDQVSVASQTPISLDVALFGLEEGVKKLQDAANVTIVPSSSVSFDLVFRANGAAAPAVVAAAAAPASTAVESTGDFSKEECAGRFEILSRAGAIYFRSGSAELDSASGPFLKSLIDIIGRCPSLNIVVAGHTDSRGGADLNQRLSEARAASVSGYMVAGGVETGRIRSLGHGETRPVAPNDTARNRGRNRRIEFAVDEN